ncbi:hypothetical protein NDU88_001886 [Pleurodeles waltl]|uniref:Uncharacterized protein n=1 Tax=Pleurodeles waltl TaxID=8319 RepID=A0AAV7U972_PLEWA|nr:hypothetical protein NDU88_001886 [Pleurodeles waltl]
MYEKAVNKGGRMLTADSAAHSVLSARVFLAVRQDALLLREGHASGPMSGRGALAAFPFNHRLLSLDPRYE